jgi:3alpha(or 20beta)-hydroxysteroid dehydrogenase
VIGDVLDDLGAALANELGQRAQFVHLDVRDPSSWDACVAVAQDRFGPPTVLVNNAAVIATGGVLHGDLATDTNVIAVNQMGCLLGMRAVAPVMIAAGGGSIVNVSSTGGLNGPPDVIAYVASKWAVRGMTKSAAVELGPHNIRVNSVHPGPVDTVMLGDDPARYDRYRALPLQRVAAPIEIARLVAYLASDDASYSTGSEFVADGGLTAYVVRDRS